jgi:hypothetical protein
MGQQLTMPAGFRTVSKVFAIWLVLLILLPFTAPWPTCELGDLKGNQASHEGLAKTKLSPDDTLVPLTESASHQRGVNSGRVHAPAPDTQVTMSSLRHAILRI